MYTVQTQPGQDFVDAARAVRRSGHGFRLEACSGLAQHIHGVESETVCQAAYLRPPHGRGEEEAVYQDDGDAPVGSMLVHPNDTELRWDIVNDVR
ncbi:hypothetical protein MALGJ_39300 [Mycolicibacter algericus]|uniref:Uncharacterized protein n=1 Tax=Mycolicibacter algericus TaxID=1288388 RepID=A0A7I9YF63_MYCAL|nr:hypothetical protein MALGJ_39300 [Mycolicibacter algericus]